MATVLVSRGCLKSGSHIISGTSHAKVRVMNDSTGASVKAAYPGAAVTVSGWKTLPNAGDDVLEGSENDIKKAVANRMRKAEIETALVDVEAINSSRKEERERRELEATLGADAAKALESQASTGPKELKLVVKADVSGSIEAVVGALQGIGNDVAAAKIISSGVGDVTESDVQMAKSAGGKPFVSWSEYSSPISTCVGMIVAFNVAVPRPIENLAVQIAVPVCSSGIIYRLIEQVTSSVIALLPPTYETKVTGEATVLALFDIQVKHSQKQVAGCRVNSGLVEKNKKARVLRNGVIIHDGMSPVKFTSILDSRIFQESWTR